MLYAHKIKIVAPIILAGGLGTRLKSVVQSLPKAMAPVLGKPFLHILLDKITLSPSFDAVYLCTGFMSGEVKDMTGVSYNGLRITYSDEDLPLGTGGALIQALHILPDNIEYLFVMNGDSYLDLDFDKYLDWFFETKADCSLALAFVDDSGRYGTVRVDSELRIKDFKEKQDGCGAGWINAGVYIFKKSLFAQFSSGQFISLEKDILPALLDSNIYGFQCGGGFIDIGTPESYTTADDFFRRVHKRQAKRS